MDYWLFFTSDWSLASSVNNTVQAGLNGLNRPGFNRPVKTGFNRAVLTAQKWSKGGQNQNCNFKLILHCFLQTFLCKVAFKHAINFKIYSNYNKVFYMVTLKDYNASSIKARKYMWHENTTTNNKNVLKEFFLFLVIPTMLHGFKD